jgi:hypothetical protein
MDDAARRAGILQRLLEECGHLAVVEDLTEQQRTAIAAGQLGAGFDLNLPYSPTPPRRPFRGLDGRQPPRQLA